MFSCPLYTSIFSPRGFHDTKINNFLNSGPPKPLHNTMRTIIEGLSKIVCKDVSGHANQLKSMWDRREWKSTALVKETTTCARK